MGTRRRRQDAPAVSPLRRWLGAASGVLVLLGVAGGGVFAYQELARPDRLPLRVVEVNGEFRHLDRADIQRTVVEVIDGGFFSCDMQKLRGAVLAMPWVADVSIRRVWPDRLKMRVTEEVPLARWGEDSLVNVGGAVFTPPSLSGYEGLVRLHGPDGSEPRLVAFFQAIVPAARQRDLRVSAVQLDQRRHWWVTFDGGLTLSLGRENVEHRLAQFFRVYPSLVARPERRPERVDMRYAHGFAVRWRGPDGQEAVAAAQQSQEKV